MDIDLQPADNPILVFGIGNPARQDDALGPLLIERFEADPPRGVDLDADYQLLVEDAEEVARHAAVVFVDAAVDAGEAPFYFRRLVPVADAGFSTHGAEPAGVVGLAASVFGAEPAAYVLGIRGRSFAMFVEEPTAEALADLDRAETFLRALLSAGDPSALAAAAEG